MFLRYSGTVPRGNPARGASDRIRRRYGRQRKGGDHVASTRLLRIAQEGKDDDNGESNSVPQNGRWPCGGGCGGARRDGGRGPARPNQNRRAQLLRPLGGLYGAVP